MSNISKCVAETTVQNKINLATADKTAEEITSIAVSDNNITQDRKVFVETIDDLPDLGVTKLGDGYVVFVNSIKTHAVSSRERWVGLDGRLLRNDANEYTIWAWGDNTSGRIGDGTTTTRLTPVQLCGGFTDWCQVDFGGTHTFGIRSNGTLWGWGNNYNGRLGDGTTTTRSSPVSVVGGFTDWCRVSSYDNHVLAIRSNGSLWTWGSNICGRLGDGTTISRTSPVTVVGGFNDWCYVSAGLNFTSAIRSNGSLWTWGCGSFGRLGDGNIIDRSSPVQVCGGFSDWCQVSAKFNSIAAIRSNGSLWAWGSGAGGQLGTGVLNNRSSPVSVIGGFTDWCQVRGSVESFLAIRTNGTIWSWGTNSNGQLGDGTTIDRSSPVSVIGGFTDWVQIAGGFTTRSGGALRSNGTVWAWGCGAQSNLGNGTNENRSSPVQVIGENWTCLGNDIRGGIRTRFPTS